MSRVVPHDPVGPPARLPCISEHESPVAVSGNPESVCSDRATVHTSNGLIMPVHAHPVLTGDERNFNDPRRVLSFTPTRDAESPDQV